jgi:formylmethanofuran dehydrogenase subunit B
MTTPATARRDTAKTSPERYENVACPFCGILCDDLEVERGSALKVRKNGCDKAIAGFERRLPATSPQVKGKDASLDEAVRAAAALIKNARLPLYGGLATDVEGMRAVMSLADRSGGVVDHALSEGQYRNFRVLQTSGWIMTTLTETRNRADLIIVAGTDVHKLHPRFFERIVCPEEAMFEDTASKRTVVFIGKGLDASAAKGKRIGEVVKLPCPVDQVGEVLGALRSVINGRPLQAKTIAGVKMAEIQKLAERCHKARYGVIVWAPPGLNYAHADLTVQLISDLVKDLNQTGRFAGLSLGGNEGAVTAGAVCAWQSGFPLRTSYASGKPEYDAGRYAIKHLLETKEGDVLVWIASFTPDLVPPETTAPSIVLGTPGIKLARPPAVFIPVGTPGIDHAGKLIRCDNVVSLPLRDLKRSDLPSVAKVLAAIEAAI